jgi:hypothetical protein
LVEGYSFVNLSGLGGGRFGKLRHYVVAAQFAPTKVSDSLRETLWTPWSAPFRSPLYQSFPELSRYPNFSGIAPFDIPIAQK